MSFESQVSDLSYDTDGASTVFSLANLYFMQGADIRASWQPAGGDYADLENGHDFNISGDGRTGGGSLTTTTARAAGGKLHIWCATPIGQPEQYGEGDSFPSATHERAQDRDAMQARDILRQVLHAIRAPDNEAPGNWVVGTKSARANKVLSFDDQGNLTTDNLSLAGALAVLANAQATLAEIEAALAQLGSQVVGLSKPTDSYLNAPAGTEPDGYRALVGKAPTGTFAGKRGQVAEKIAGTWMFSGALKAGQRLWDNGSGLQWVVRNGWWNKLKPGFTGYQDFADVPDGTAANGMIIATGQAINLQGATTSPINNGRIEPSSNVYTVLPLHGKNVKLGMRGRWKAAHANGNGMALAVGTYVGGAIISKMAAHADFEYQGAPAVSIWGGPRDLVIGGVHQGYQIEPGLQYEYQSVDTNLPVHGTGVDVVEELQVSGNTIRAWADGGHWANSYTDDMVSALLGDDGSGNLGYMYFQSGPNADANNPYIYEIWWTELDTPQEVLPDPKQIPDPSKVPIGSGGNFAFGSATELFRYTPVDGGAANMFEIDIGSVSAGVVLGYAGTVQKWRCGGGKFGGDITAQAPVQLGGDYVMSLNSAVITLGGSLTQVVSGADIVIKYTPSRTGSDASAYAPQVSALLRQLAQIIPVTT